MLKLKGILAVLSLYIVSIQFDILILFVDVLVRMAKIRVVCQNNVYQSILKKGHYFWDLIEVHFNKKRPRAE